MGATGLGSGKRGRTKGSFRTYGIYGARKLTEPVPKESGFTDQGKNDIRISVNTDEEKDIVFQFKLVDGGKNMSIRAYDPNVPSKGITEVKTSSPSLSAVMNDPNASATEKSNAMKIRDMMNRSKKGITESSLAKIANELQRKQNKGRSIRRRG